MEIEIDQEEEEQDKKEGNEENMNLVASKILSSNEVVERISKMDVEINEKVGQVSNQQIETERVGEKEEEKIAQVIDVEVHASNEEINTICKIAIEEDKDVETTNEIMEIQIDQEEEQHDKEDNEENMNLVTSEALSSNEEVETISEIYVEINKEVGEDPNEQIETKRVGEKEEEIVQAINEEVQNDKEEKDTIISEIVTIATPSTENLIRDDCMRIPLKTYFAMSVCDFSGEADIDPQPVDEEVQKEKKEVTFNENIEIKGEGDTTEIINEKELGFFLDNETKTDLDEERVKEDSIEKVEIKIEVKDVREENWVTESPNKDKQDESNKEVEAPLGIAFQKEAENVTFSENVEIKGEGEETASNVELHKEKETIEIEIQETVEEDMATHQSSEAEELNPTDTMMSLPQVEEVEVKEAA
jgi:hypothetical protein